MLLPTMGYIDNTLNYLKGTLESVKSAVISTKDVIITIGNIIGTIVDILGFIGFRVFILLLITTLILWFLNLVSPISKKTNYFIGVGLVLWLAIANNMPTQMVILKYVLIVISPFIITTIANFLLDYLTKFSKIIYQKILSNTIEINFSFLKKRKKYSLDFNDKISILLSSDLPTLEQVDEIKELVSYLKYEPIIYEYEKISLVGEDKKIIFSNDSKFNQFIKSVETKDIKLLWFWSSYYGANELLEYLKNSKKIIQNKLVIGGGDNSFVLNFLQRKWNWEVIYGNNLKEFIARKDEKLIGDILESSKTCDLTLINDYNIEENNIIKSKIVGGDLSVLIAETGENSLNFKNKILFLDVVVENKKNLYRLLNQLQNYIINNNITPKAIVFGNIILKDSSISTEIIQYFINTLKNKNLIFPIFQIKNFDFIRLNSQCIVEYKDNKISLKIL